MIELDADNIVPFLSERGWLAPGASARAELLGWGVSNVVLRVSPSIGEDFVVKQSREQLRTQAAWFSRLDRIWREKEALQVAGSLLPAGAVPGVLHEDRDNYVFAMEAVAADHRVWKADLLAGRFDRRIATEMGTTLRTLHRGTVDDPALAAQWADSTIFDQLRIDPFYRRIATEHPDIAPAVDELIADQAEAKICMVLADFSPKNILISQRDGREQTTLVDFETAHYGDPAFDLGFFLSHLALKTILHRDRFDEVLALVAEFLATYADAATLAESDLPFCDDAFSSRVTRHAAACMLARIDGKSPVDYLKREEQRALAREFSRSALLRPAESIEELISRLASELRRDN